MIITGSFAVAFRRWATTGTCLWLLMAYAGAWAQTRQVVTYYDQSRTQVKEKYTLADTHPPVLQGAYQSFYSNGKVHSQGSYQKGIPQGKWEYYYENGHLKMAGELRQNKKNGFWKYYFENGQPQMEGTLQENLRTGHWNYYYESGALKSAGSFENDHKNGVWHYYYEDGRKKAEGTFVQDNGWYREFYASGTVRMEGLLRNGQSDSLWRYYHENGKLKASGTEKNGVREDTWLFFDETETLQQEGEYKNGVPNGKWRHYHPNGKIAAEGQKTAGKEDGIWNLFYTDGSTRSTIDYSQTDNNYREYYENGKLKVKGTIRDGLYEGPWEYFYEDDGTLEGRCEFGNGKGLYKGIYKDGKPRMEGHMENDRRVGRWTLYKPDGSVAGYYEAFYGKNLPAFVPQSPAVVTDTLPRTSLPYEKPSLRLPKKRNWHFIAKANEYRAFIIGINPLGMLWLRNPGLPISFEYYMHERLGYEVTASLYRKPFFASHSAIASDQNFSRGFSLGIKQKFYQPDGDWGMLYVAHELRFTGIGHLANVQDNNLATLTIRANEARYEYSLMIGDRLLPDPSRKSRRFTLDSFAGLGIAYRHYSPQWSNRPDWDQIFSDVHKSRVLFTLRLGIMAGYAF